MLRETPRSPLADQLHLASRAGPKPSERTLQVLRRYDLDRRINGDVCELLNDLQVYLAEDCDPELLYAFTELSFLGGKRIETASPEQALDLYGSAVAHAYLYLFDQRIAFDRNPYDPQFRSACDLYNGALESALRLVRQQGDLRPGVAHRITTTQETWDVTVVARGDNWFGHDFDRFEFVSDYEVEGLTNLYRTYGLGVPLIAVRKASAAASDQPSSVERCYPPNLSFPATAFLRVLPAQAGTAATGHQQALLELYDPLTATDVPMARGRVPLESDLTTPLAYFLENTSLKSAGTLGLLRPGEGQALRGLYMVQPYQPGKIPVLMVHGLWSSPITWMEMFNDLRASPELRRRYQFWFYLYPTGQPFWESALQLRHDLAELRRALDPLGREAALDQMVVVGHSMGGLVARMQTIDSGDQYWRIVSDQPFQLVTAEEPVRAHLEELFFFRPNPSIRRLITIGTPHHGSNFANPTTRFIGKTLIRMPQNLMARQQVLYRDNREVFRDPELLSVKTSIDSLAPDSPIFPVMSQAASPPWLLHHNIVGVIREPNFVESLAGRFSGVGDGVVSFDSAHLEQAATELVVDADHNRVHRHPLAVLEVRRILLEHLRQLDAGGPREQLPDRTVTRPDRPAAAMRLYESTAVPR